MVKPINMKADDINVNGLLRSAESLNYFDYVDVSSEQETVVAQLLKDYKLNAEVWNQHNAIEFVTDGAAANGTPLKKISLHLGETNPLTHDNAGNSAAGILEDAPKKILFVPNYFIVSFLKDLTHWREKKLNHFERRDIILSKVQTKSPFILKNQNADWFVSPSESEKNPFMADLDRVDDFNQEITNLKVKEFTFEDKNDAAAKKFLSHAKSLGSIESVIQDHANKEKPSETILMKFFEALPTSEAKDATPGIFVVLSQLPGVYQIESSARSLFEKDLKTFRVMKLISREDSFSIERIEFQGLGITQTVTMEHDENRNWIFKSPEKVLLADDKKASNLLDELFSNKIRAFIAPEKVSESDALKLVIYYKEAGKREFHFWKKEGRILCKDLQSKRSEMLVMDFSIENSFPWDMKFFEKPPTPSAEKEPKTGKT